MLILVGFFLQLEKVKILQKKNKPNIFQIFEVLYILNPKVINQSIKLDLYTPKNLIIL